MHKKQRGNKSALSLDAFTRAKRSTYDKRVVLEKQRNLAAAKVNKYRKVQKRLGDTVAMDDAFDPEKYAKRLEEMEAANGVVDDGMGGRGGRAPVAADAPGAKKKLNIFKREKRKRKGIVDAGEDDEDDDDDDDDEFANNVVENGGAKRRRGGRGGRGGEEGEDSDDDDENSEHHQRKNKKKSDGGGGGGSGVGVQARPGMPSGKGWNKTVKDKLKWEKEKAAREEVRRATRRGR